MAQVPTQSGGSAMRYLGATCLSLLCTPRCGLVSTCVNPQRASEVCLVYRYRPS